MLLSELYINESKMIKDGEFDILAQCVINSDKKVLTFFEDNKYYDIIMNNPSISCIICKPEDSNLFIDHSMGIIVSKQPRLTFFKIHNILSQHKKFILSDKNNNIGLNCHISSHAHIAEKNVSIGNNTIIEENVCIKEHVTIGDNVIIRSGSIIGGQGFEFKKNYKDDILRVEHSGQVIIRDNVEIKELCTIHKAVFYWDSTIIGDFTKIDAHTHIGHAGQIGNRVMIGSHCNISGNVIIEDDVYIGPGVTLSNRIIISKNARVNIGSVVNRDVQMDTSVTGNFAIDHDKFIMDLKNK